MDDEDISYFAIFRIWFLAYLYLGNKDVMPYSDNFSRDLYIEYNFFLPTLHLLYCRSTMKHANIKRKFCVPFCDVRTLQNEGNNF